VIDQVAAALRSAGLEPTWEDVADTLWLAREIARHESPVGPEEPSPDAAPGHLSSPQTGPTRPGAAKTSQADREKDGAKTSAASATASLQLPSLSGSLIPPTGLPFETPAATALPGTLALAHALRPLKRRVPSATTVALDEEATAERAAEQGIWTPVLRPALTRWLDLALVVDQSPSMAVWTRTVDELRRLLERHGAFRDVRIWLLETDTTSQRPALYAGTESVASSARLSTPRELIDPGGKRLILLVSDCVAPAWSSGAVPALLSLWGRTSPVAVVHVLPQRLWRYTAIEAQRVELRAPYPGAPNSQLQVASWLASAERELEAVITALQDETRTPAGAAAIPVPVITLQPHWLAPWASLVAGAGGRQVPAFVTWAKLGADESLDTPATAGPEPPSAVMSPAERVENFRAIVSPTAFELAGYLADVPLTLPIMRLVQQAMLPGSAQAHLAEVLLGGILERRTPAGSVHPDQVEYDFVDGTRELLRDTVLGTDILRVVHVVGDFIGRRTGRAQTFPSLLLTPDETSARSHEERVFAAVTASTLRRFGTSYEDFARRLEDQAGTGAAADSTPQLESERQTLPVSPPNDTRRKRRRLDPVGPFGNPDGSRVDIDDLTGEFVDFDGNPAYGHLATRADDSMVRVIVGKLGAGKTVYLRRLQDFQARKDSVYADVPQQSPPRTEVIVKACQWFSDSVLVEKWMQIWERAIMRSLASHLLRRPELRQQLRDEQAEDMEQSYARLLGEFRRPRSIYSQVRDIINERHTAHQLFEYLDDPLWDDLEDLLGEVLGQCKPVYFYLDALTEEFSHAPMYWLRCQEGLFYQVMRLLRDHRFRRLHVVICIWDVVISSVYRSEHAPRYYNEPHIHVLNWDHGSLFYLLGQKLQRLPPAVLMRRPADGIPTIRDWLGIDGDWRGPDGSMTIEEYLLGHTRLIPRDIISLGNELSEEVLRQKQAGHDRLAPEVIQAVVQRCAKRFGDSQLAQCANQISSDLMPQNAALYNYSELFTSTQAYISGVQEDVRSFVRMIGVDRFSRGDLEALQEMADLHFERATDLASILWQNGLLGYVDEAGRRRYYSQGDFEEIRFLPEVDTYVLHPCLVHAVGGIRHVLPDASGT
jgi:hypothetical protein